MDNRSLRCHLRSGSEPAKSQKLCSLIEWDEETNTAIIKQNSDLIDKYGFLQEIVKIDAYKENADH